MKAKYICRACKWKDTTAYGMDKCPNCGGDDWKKVKPKKKHPRPREE